MTNLIPLVGSDYPKKVIPLIDDARKSIEIVVYDWRWYANKPNHPAQQFNRALVRAVNRGVLVKAVCNRPAIVSQLQEVGIKARTLRDKRTVHTKLIIIDDETLVIGSHNFTQNAFSRNIETSVIVDIPDDVQRLREFFQRLYQI